MNTTVSNNSVRVGGAWPMVRALGGVGMICSLLIVSTYEFTLPIITEKKARALEAAVFQVLPEAVESKTFQLGADQRFFLSVAGDTKGERVHVGYTAEGRAAGIAIEASGQGFQDIIRIIYGYSPHQQTVVGFRVLESRETPGLGDRVETDAAFLANFAALDLSLAPDGGQLKNPVEAVKSGARTHPWQVECITGATITSKAIARIIGESGEQIAPLLQSNMTLFEDN